jgi:oxepin-CoA hydrolase / 3-oxo-5,6-dehydrosuberyl-CoA semialdehyde dehydrogenase
MKTIPTLEYYFEHEIKALLQPLTHQTLPLWGTMNATQMLDHLNDALKLSMGIYSIPEQAIVEKWEKYKNITLLSDRPIPKDFDNPILKLLTKPNPVGFDNALKNLFENYSAFKTTFYNEEDTFKTPHNMFGFLNYHEWLWFHYKHFSHHFAQFGLHPYIERFEL